MVARLVTTPAAYDLLHAGALALADVEAAGVRVDVDYLNAAWADADARIRDCEAELRAAPEYRVWQRRYGERTNLASPEQLAGVVFGDLGYKSRGRTAGGKRDRADESAFEGIDLPFVKTYFAAQKMRKGRDTYLAGIRRELVQHLDDGCWYVHPSYNLNTVITFRSSCDSPNWQNVPVRNPALAEIIRRCYIPRPGCQLIEIDYGQIEVRIPCCYTFDPVLIDYVCDPDKDMHRDMACEIFRFDPGAVPPGYWKGDGKPVRHLSKNSFVFPTFYGSYYAQCAPHLWEAVDHRKLKAPDGGSLRDHLTRVGLAALGACDPKHDPAPGTFEHHLKRIEDDFWGRRFAVYAQWKRDWWAAYKRHGGFQMLTGFAVNGVLDRKQVCNSPIQGVAFHCLLWSLSRLVRWLRKYRMRTVVIGEIHDSLVLDGPPCERDDVIDAATRIMTEEIKTWATWLNVPLETEPELCPVGRSWFDKAALKRSAAGLWVPANGAGWEEKYGPWDLQLAG